MGILQPRLLFLDSSQLSAWARDRVAQAPARRERAAMFAESLIANGFVPLFSWHHVQELLGTKSTGAASAAVSLMETLPFAAWIGHADGSDGPGSIVDQMAGELIAAVSHPDADDLTIRGLVRPRLIRFGTGGELASIVSGCWEALQPLFWQEAEGRRRQFAVTAATDAKSRSVRIIDLLEGRAGHGGDVGRRLSAQQLALQRDVARHGDHRLEDPAAVSQWFMDQVREIARDLPPSMPEITKKLLAIQGHHLEDLHPEDTVGDVLDRGEFRTKMEIAAEAAGLPDGSACQVRHQQMPSWTIDAALSRHRQPGNERLGSEPVDAHLACAAIYSDIAFVDKRTLEYLRQARAAGSLPAGLLDHALPNQDYANVPTVF